MVRLNKARDQQELIPSQSIVMDVPMNLGTFGTEHREFLDSSPDDDFKIDPERTPPTGELRKYPQT